ncbi:DNA-binding MarR family transcriptional regulator [Microbacterium sp. BE35]|uniref:MarR family winged helix-turn-helix transcriptional regulator n=1 Tax=Microbacterium sp. BE35 TaxID=2817773 RepID=UPI00285E99CF|nr:MarR family transcriptional regulator [Microbacterium sp. BE35]MDR7188198.1 DNA-binding MarR family transcriptional regulator [Microbacterium sp. BE35]
MSNADDASQRYPASSPTMVMILQGRRLEAQVEAALKTLGLSMRRLGLLGHLSREPGISYSALARRAGIKVQSLHPIMDGLVAEGYVATVGSVDQGRAAVIELTPRGRDALSQANGIIASFDRDAFSADEYHQELGRALSSVGEYMWRSRGAAGSAE